MKHSLDEHAPWPGACFAYKMTIQQLTVPTTQTTHALAGSPTRQHGQHTPHPPICSKPDHRPRSRRSAAASARADANIRKYVNIATLAACAKEHTQLLIALPAFRAKGQGEATPRYEPQQRTSWLHAIDSSSTPAVSCRTLTPC